MAAGLTCNTVTSPVFSLPFLDLLPLPDASGHQLGNRLGEVVMALGNGINPLT